MIRDVKLSSILRVDYRKLLEMTFFFSFQYIFRSCKTKCFLEREIGYSTQNLNFKRKSCVLDTHIHNEMPI